MILSNILICSKYYCYTYLTFTPPLNINHPRSLILASDKRSILKYHPIVDDYAEWPRGSWRGSRSHSFRACASPVIGVSCKILCIFETGGDILKKIVDWTDSPSSTSEFALIFLWALTTAAIVGIDFAKKETPLCELTPPQHLLAAGKKRKINTISEPTFPHCGSLPRPFFAC